MPRETICSSRRLFYMLHVVTMLCTECGCPDWFLRVCVGGPGQREPPGRTLPPLLPLSPPHRGRLRQRRHQRCHCHLQSRVGCLFISFNKTEPVLNTQYSYFMCRVGGYCHFLWLNKNIIYCSSTLLTGMLLFPFQLRMYIIQHSETNFHCFEMYMYIYIVVVYVSFCKEKLLSILKPFFIYLEYRCLYSLCCKFIFIHLYINVFNPKKNLKAIQPP